MKKTLLLSFFLIFTQCLFAQSPKSNKTISDSIELKIENFSNGNVQFECTTDKITKSFKIKLAGKTGIEVVRLADIKYAGKLYIDWGEYEPKDSFKIDSFDMIIFTKDGEKKYRSMNEALTENMKNQIKTLRVDDKLIITNLMVIHNNGSTRYLPSPIEFTIGKN